MDFSATILFLALLISSAKALDPCGSQSDGSDLSVIPIYGKWSSTLLAQKTTAVPIASAQQVLNIGNYVVRVKIGTPGQLMFMVLDTSNDVAWVPCSGCTGCSATTFSPNTSTSYGLLDCSLPQCTHVRGLPFPEKGTAACSFNQSYGGDSYFSANLVQDALRLANDVVPDFAFGCINSVSGGSIPQQGLLGLGRGPMSLISQSGALYSGVFRIVYLVSSPTTIRVFSNLGQHRTVVTRFVQPFYNAIRDEFVKHVKGPFTTIGVFDTCFDATAEAQAPLITLHFEGFSMTLPMENSFLHTSGGNRACLAMAAVPNNVNVGMNVIANLQQQNHRILFDVTNSRLGIAREACN
ncbi:hypothetical protein F3Y22_tig00116965pilonHSYRG00490 [Hibiscus syriacus]|uniref:Peptidase A1 domain-containing protein n=1 Tax=Hibiscus syriacus TaxID=106335 RepID=A0A6A2WJZ7_HIBSY|nr:hypothetical protein F3Y22_tig00116965pilonHSYRG00490 [Hibiscus syriacus]